MVSDVAPRHREWNFPYRPMRFTPPVCEVDQKRGETFIRPLPAERHHHCVGRRPVQIRTFQKARQSWRRGGIERSLCGEVDPDCFNRQERMGAEPLALENREADHVACQSKSRDGPSAVFHQAETMTARGRSENRVVLPVLLEERLPAIEQLDFDAFAVRADRVDVAL